jgi:hypothetical protein
MSWGHELGCVSTTHPNQHPVADELACVPTTQRQPQRPVVDELAA